MPHGEDELADPQDLRVPEPHGGDVNRIDPNEGDVRDGIASEHLAVQVTSVREVDPDPSGALYDVLVRDEIPLRVDDNRRGRRGCGERSGASPTSYPHALDAGHAGSDRLDRGGDPRLELAQHHDQPLGVVLRFPASSGGAASALGRSAGAVGA
jgi:hypothetical protein